MVEMGFMSTSMDWRVAKEYARRGRAGTVMELETGLTDAPADISAWSQYPVERELCLPPLTGFSFEECSFEDGVLFLKGRIHVNKSSPSITQVKATRFNMMEGIFRDENWKIERFLDRCDPEADGVLSELSPA